MIWIYNHSILASLIRMGVCILLLLHMEQKDAKFSPISKLHAINENNHLFNFRLDIWLVSFIMPRQF